MTSLLISPTSPAELKLLQALLKKMNIPAKALTDDEKEDFGLSVMIMQALNDPEVSEDEVMLKLGRP